MSLRLTIQVHAKNLNFPHLIIHGDADTSVDLKEALALHKWHPRESTACIGRCESCIWKPSSLGFLVNYPLIYSKFTQKSPLLLTICVVLKKKSIYLIFFLERIN